MRLIILIFITFSLLIPTALFSKENKILTITHQTKQSKNDKCFEYDNELLKLALEKTKTKYGPYRLVPLDVKANFKRIEAIALEGKVQNLFYKTSVTQERIKKLGYVDFPVDLGIVGYRVGFINKKI